MKRIFTFADGSTREETYERGSAEQLAELTDAKAQERHFPEHAVQTVNGRKRKVYNNPLVSVQDVEVA